MLDEENFGMQDADKETRNYKRMDGLILEKTTQNDTFFRIRKFDIPWDESLMDVKVVQEWRVWKGSFRMTKIIII